MEKILSIIALLVALGFTSAWADPYQSPDELFPPSRFGMAPLRVQTGVQRGVASQETTAMDASARTHGESDQTDPNIMPAVEPEQAYVRKPAGLELAGSQPVKKQPISAPARDLTSSDKFIENASQNATSAADPRYETRGVQEVALIASDLGYFPKTIFVSRDVPVRLFVTGASKNTLCIMIDSLQVRKQVRSQKIEEIPFTPSTPGKFRFYCPVNGMEGTMVVKEFSSDISQPSANGSNTVTHVSAADMIGN